MLEALLWGMLAINTMIKCKLTGKTGKGIKAHIVPRSFYEISPQEDGFHKLLSNSEGTFPKKTPVGIYDDTIVTIEGEECFRDWDDYASRILISEAQNLEEKIVNNKLVAWTLPNYDYSSLKLFALSVLWRSHASAHSAFSKVNLGPHEAAIRTMLLNNDPGDDEKYSVNIVRWLSHDFGPVFMDPFREKYGYGINYYRIYCGRYVLYVKVDKRISASELRDFQLGATSELYLIARELQKSKEWPIMQQIVQHNVANKVLRLGPKLGATEL